MLRDPMGQEPGSGCPPGWAWPHSGAGVGSIPQCQWQFGASRGAPASALCPIPQVFTRYGKCYTFNAGQDGKPRLITMKGGTGNGLEIMLDIQQDEYLPVWGETGNPAAPGLLPSSLPAPHSTASRPQGSFLLFLTTSGLLLSFFLLAYAICHGNSLSL